MGWIGNALIIFGAWHIGHKRRWAFLCTMAGGLCWVSEGVWLMRADLIFIEIVMSLIAFRNFLKWRKNK